MSILVNRKSKVIVQGITSGNGSYHTARMVDYGTNIAGGVAPGMGGQKVEDRPVFDTVKECVDYTGADTSVIFLPARFVKKAAIEAIRAGTSLIVIVAEHIPVHDMHDIGKEAQEYGTIVLGGKTAGIISPGQAYLGIMPDVSFSPGRVGIVSQSTAITNNVADALTSAGYGQSTCVNLGSDSVPGSTFSEILLMFENDPETKAVVIIGEIDGNYEEMVVETIGGMKTPVLAMIEEKTGTAKEKLETLASAGVHPCKTFEDISKTLERLGV